MQRAPRRAGRKAERERAADEDRNHYHQGHCGFSICFHKFALGRFGTLVIRGSLVSRYSHEFGSLAAGTLASRGSLLHRYSLDFGSRTSVLSLRSARSRSSVLSYSRGSLFTDGTLVFNGSLRFNGTLV